MNKLAGRLLARTNLNSETFSGWLPVVYTAFIFLLALALSYGIAPGQLLPGHSPAEAAVLEATSTFPDPFENFLYWPYHLGVYLLRFVVSDGVLAARIFSSASALLVAGTFLLLLRRRFGVLISLAGTSLLVLNSWMLQLARAGTPEMTSLAFLLVLAACLTLMKDYGHSLQLKLAALTAAVLNWFTPLAPWLITALFLHIFYRHRVLRRLLSSRLKLSLVITYIVLAAVMFLSFSYDQQAVFVAWGIPEAVESVRQVGDNFLQTLKSLVWQAPYNASRWLGRLPLLDVFIAAMIPFGLYFARQQPLLRVGKAYLGFGALGLLVIAGLNAGIKTQGVEMLLPLIIIVAVVGLHEFADHWKKVFPFNPLARAIGIMIIVILVNMSLFYQVRRYFAAWIQHPQTQEIYSLQQPEG
ncbi:hypothetical protein F4X86_01225 [Candidatus Saccharibacteria bacterium]|nr:hypothetical protein [Candidatus Saccharibacteria bacterium]